MTRIILEDVLLITELAQRLKIKYKIEKLSSDLKPYKTDNQTNYLLKEGVDVSNYGDPSQWQKKVRKDRH